MLFFELPFIKQIIRVLSIILLLLASFSISAQSLKKSSNTIKEEIASLLEMANQDSSWGHSLEYINEAYKLASEHSLIREQISIKVRLSGHYLKIKDINNALKCGLEAKNIAVEGNYQKRGVVHYNLAQILKKINADNDAVFQFKQQLKWNLKNNVYPDANATCNAIAGLYFYSEQLDSAMFYYVESMKYLPENISKHKLAHANNNIGLVLLKQNLVDSSLHYFNLANQVIDEVKNKRENSLFMWAVIQGNIGACHLRKGNVDLGLEHIELKIKSIHKTNHLKELSNVYSELARHHLTAKEYHKAEFYLDSASYYLPVKNKKARIKLLKTYVELYTNTLSPRIHAIFKEYTQLNDSLYGEKVIHQLFDSRSLYQMAHINGELKLQKMLLKQSEAEVKGMEQTEKINELRSYLLIGAILVICIISLFIFYKIKSDHKKKTELQNARERLIQVELKNKDLEQIKLSEELSQKNAILTNYALEISRKRNLLEEFKKEMKALEFQGKEKSKEYKDLFQKVNSHLGVEESLRKYQEEANLLHQNFNEKIKKRHPEITQNDLYLCGLVRLGLTNKEIASIKYVSEKAIRMGKYRLKKKINLTINDDISEYLNQID